ncbi:peptidyl-prolyl cis-trans isomerase [bacterium]|nr:peptidyl-prolyl cis-trans isomerase [bacterium]
MKRLNFPVAAAGLSVLVGAVVFSLGGCARSGDVGGIIVPNKIIGTVEGKPLTQGWFIDRFFEFSKREAFYQAAGSETAWMTREAMRFLADEKLAESARRLGLDQTREFTDALEERTNELLIRDYRSHRLYGNIRVSRQDVKRFYEDNREDFTRPDRYRFNYIAISKTRRPPLEARRMAEEAYGIIKAGGDFLAVAHDFSDVNPFRKLMDFEVSAGQRKVSPVLLETLAALSRGKISGIAESDEYYYIVRLLSVTQGMTAPLAQVEPMVRSEIFRRQATRVRAAFREKMERAQALKIELNDSLVRRRESSPRDIVLSIRERNGDEILLLTLGDFSRLASEFTDVRDQVEFLHELAENELIRRAAADENFRESDVVKYDLALWANRLLAEAYLQQRVNDELPARITEEKIDQCLAETPGLNQTLRQLRAYIITQRAEITDLTDRVEKYAAMRLAENQTWDVLGKIVRGLDFRIAAQLYSDDPSFRNGGDVGVVYSGPMGRRFDEVAFRMQEGEISDPVELQDGYMLIWVDRVFPEEPLPAEEARRRARERLKTLETDEIRLEEYRKFTESMTGDWDAAALQETADVIKDLDGDKALVLYRQRYGM